MTQKGLFSSIFVLIMLALFLPTANYVGQANVVKDLEMFTNDVLISADNVIADSLADASESTCALVTEAIYDSTVQTYLDSYFSEVNDLSSFACNYSSFSSTLTGFDYEGSVQITCFYSGEIVSNLSLSRTLKFSKEISNTYSDPTCTQVIKDNYDSDSVQLELIR